MPSGAFKENPEGIMGLARRAEVGTLQWLLSIGITEIMRAEPQNLNITILFLKKQIANLESIIIHYYLLKVQLCPLSAAKFGCQTEIYYPLWPF